MPAIRPSHPRPVADAPVAALADGVEVAKAWLVELVAGAELEAAGRVPVADLAREGPALCAALMAAVGSDAAVPRLAELARGAGALAGAADAAEAVLAAEALRRAAWGCLADALPRGEEAVATELALRLAHLGALVAARAAGAFAGAAEPAFAAPAAVTIDLVLERALLDGAPFAVLLVELDDLDRLLAAGVDGIDEAVGRAGRAVAAALEPAPEIVTEGAGRWWAIVAPGKAAELAERVAAAIAGAGDHRGVALTASVGLAVSPEDGAAVAQLRARAEQGVFAARAGGISIAPR